MTTRLPLRSWVRAKRTVILLGAIGVGLLDLVFITTVARDARGLPDAATGVRAHVVEFQLAPESLPRFP